VARAIATWFRKLHFWFRVSILKNSKFWRFLGNLEKFSKVGIIWREIHFFSLFFRLRVSQIKILLSFPLQVYHIGLVNILPVPKFFIPKMTVNLDSKNKLSEKRQKTNDRTAMLLET
jgi:hypothetical protein